MVRILLLCIFWLLATAAQAEEGDQKTKDKQALMTSIYPLALLINSAWPNDVEAVHLVPANQSPHDFSLKPSHRRALDQTPFVLWLGPGLEPYLKRVLSSKQNHLALLPKSDHHDDPHIWLAPNKIQWILAQVQQQLDLPAPSEFLLKLTQWENSAKELLAPNKQKGFVVYHSAFTHWVTHFELNQLAAVTTDPDHPVGSRHLLNVRKTIEAQSPACLFTEPQFSPRIVNKLVSGLNIPLIEIDPIAGQYQLPEQNFLDFYDGLTQAFVTCLSN